MSGPEPNRALPKPKQPCRRQAGRGLDLLHKLLTGAAALAALLRLLL